MLKFPILHMDTHVECTNITFAGDGWGFSQSEMM